MNQAIDEVNVDHFPRSKRALTQKDCPYPLIPARRGKVGLGHRTLRDQPPCFGNKASAAEDHQNIADMSEVRSLSL